MGVLDDLDQADIMGNDPYFQPGRYIAKITQVFFKTGGFKGDTFIIKAAILGANSGHEDAPQAGSNAAYAIKMSGDETKIRMGRGNLMQFLTSTYRVEQSAYSGPQWTQIVADVCDNNSLAGTVLALECFTTETKPKFSGGPAGIYTVHAWKGAPTAAQYEDCGMSADGQQLAGAQTQAAPAAPAQEPMYNKTDEGKDIVSHDGGKIWAFV